MTTSITHALTKPPSPPVIVRARCKHCGNTLIADANDDFCCAGCRAVYGLVCDAGLTRYYELRDATIVAPADIGAMSRCDRNWLEPLDAKVTEAKGVIELPIKLQGLRCTACVWLIQKLFERRPGAKRIVVNSARGTARLSVDSRFPLPDFVLELERFGYLAGDVGQREERDDESLLRLGVCLALAANAMMFSAAIYFGLSQGPLHDLLHTLNFACATLSVVIGAPVFLTSAWNALQRRILHLDLPIAVGIVLSYGAALWSFATGRDTAAYYDSLAIFIALMLLGRWLKERILLRNRRDLLANSGLDGLLVRRVKGVRVVLIAAMDVEAGDEILVPPGDLIPVSGTLLGAPASCSLDWITGESEPVAYIAGALVPAGAFNAGNSAIRLTCQSDFSDSQLCALLGQTQFHEAQDGGATHVFSIAYVATVLVTGALGFAFWAVHAGITRGLEVATAIYVVTCPCAIGIAAPMAEELVIAGLRRAGLFVRSSSFLERALAVRQIVFDKTGTLTTGRLQLLDPTPLAALDARARDVLYTLVSVNAHPKSNAVADALAPYPKQLIRDARVVEETGSGVMTRLDGHVYRLGRASWALPAADGGGTSDLVFSVDGRVLCRLGARETLRSDARIELALLERAGYETSILSGDDATRVSVLAHELGIPEARAHGGRTPQDKAAFIAAHDRRDMLMIGDGVNDSLAVAQAFTSGTPSIDRAVMPSRTDFYFVTAGLAPIRRALLAAHKLSSVLSRNRVFAIAYNVLVVGVALSGAMKPWLAAVLMPLSSIVVLASTSSSLSSRSSLWKS